MSCCGWQAARSGAAANAKRQTRGRRRTKFNLLAASKKLVAIGDGCTTHTSTPRLLTSAASDVANIVMNALVLAYMALRGLGTNPADDDVKAMYPRCFLSSSLFKKWWVIFMELVALHS